MRLYEDLIGKVTPEERGGFCQLAVLEFKTSETYRVAQSAEHYYGKHNETIERFQKWLYRMSGDRIPDHISANYKIKTGFFRRLVTQQTQYVLGNGFVLNDKDRLGKDIDYQVQLLAKKAITDGQAFGFWNYDHLEVFSLAETVTSPGFCPLYSLKDGVLKAGIRFWTRKLGDSYVTFYTLYDETGIEEYRSIDNGTPELINKYGYKTRITTNTIKGIINMIEENYSTLPIFPLYANDGHISELEGIREAIDAYDLIKSGLANQIDDFATVYWAIEGAGGMEDADIARFMQRVKTVHAAVGGDDLKATPHVLDVPYEARERMLDILRKDIYQDFGSVDLELLRAGNKTATEVRALFITMNNKCADFEYELIKFFERFLPVVGINDVPRFNWQIFTNELELTQEIMMAQGYLTPKVLVRKLPFLTDDDVEEIYKEYDEKGWEVATRGERTYTYTYEGKGEDKEQ